MKTAIIATFAVTFLAGLGVIYASSEDPAERETALVVAAQIARSDHRWNLLRKAGASGICAGSGGTASSNRATAPAYSSCRASSMSRSAESAFFPLMR